MGHTSAMKDCILTAVVQSCEMFLNLSARSWSGLVKCGPISYSYELQKIMYVMQHLNVMREDLQQTTIK